jgi:hypothetical protein
MSKHSQDSPELKGRRVFITSGRYCGAEGVCLGKSADSRKWAISPDSSEEIISLEFEKEFGLLIDLSSDPQNN